MAGLNYEPRLAETMDEVGNAATKALEEIQSAFAAYKENRTAANRRNLEATIRNAAPNMTYAAKSLSEHAENVVQRARADIEAVVVAKAEQLGIDPAEVADTRLLEAADPKEDQDAAAGS